jgi:hypothetical protein
VALICSGLFVKVASTNTLYAITNRRVIIMRTGRLLCVDSYSKESIRQVRRIERADESGDLLIATQTGSVYMGNSNYNHMINGQGTLAAIANVRQVEKKLLSMLHEA